MDKPKEFCMTTDSGKKIRDFWIYERFNETKVLTKSPYNYPSNWFQPPVYNFIHVREVTPCHNCDRLEDQLYHESRKAPEIEYKLGHEIEVLQAKLDKACVALEYYRGSDDDETGWQEPDNFVPYWTLWDNGDCVNGKRAREALQDIRKKDEK